MKKIILTDGTEITEKKRGGCYEYYIGKVFVFGVEEPFTQAELQRLANNGYFDFFKI